MKSPLFKIVLLLALAPFAGLQANDEIDLSKQKPEIRDGEYLYEIKEGEAFVNDELITLFAIGKEDVSVAYRNKTEKKKKPSYTIEIYNAYGLMIASKEVGKSVALLGPSTYMEPNAVSAEKIYLDKFPLLEILGNTNIQIPEDLMTMK
ncbi:hypothetical protein [Rubritalea sp.]|uniref:hypothetical protein n=1 Tax=Rubritalea sp. TaxID=2109375 RepID=UPI003EFA86D0